MALERSDLKEKLSRRERGQAMTEYVILVILVALLCIPVYRTLPAAVRGYVRPFYYCVSRPIP
jgi:Flp pilus assembly pilin Flp